MKNKQLLILAMVGLVLSLGVGQLIAQASSSTIDATTSTPKKAAKKTKESAVKAADATVDTTKKATDATVDTSKKAATETKKGAVKATDATVDTTKKATNATVDATKKGATATADTTKKAADATAEGTKKTVNKATGKPAAGPPPQKGMVWVNTDSGAYHKEGSRWYGNTKQGKYMTETDAQKAGYQAAKSE